MDTAIHFQASVKIDANQNNKKIPRPLNSFMIYRLEKQKEIIDQCPGTNHRDISKIVSKWWKKMTLEEKMPYTIKADKLKLEHRKMYPDYKFNPQKRVGNRRPYKKRSIHELTAIDVKKRQNLISKFGKELAFDDVFSSDTNKSGTISSALGHYYVNQNNILTYEQMMNERNTPTSLYHNYRANYFPYYVSPSILTRL